MNIKTLIIRTGKTLSKNSPTILTGLGVAGLLSTTILAVKATPKALEVLKNEQDYRESLNRPIAISKTETIKLCWKLYLPSAVIGVVTVTCIIGAHTVNFRRNAAMASLYSLTETAFKEYQAKVTETIGSNKEGKLRDSINQDIINRNPSGINQVILTGKGKVLCYDKLCDRYFESDHETIRRVINDINMDLRNEMFVELNDLYYKLGLAPTGLGYKVGWDIDHGYIDPKMSSCLNENNEPCLVLDFEVYPKYIT